MDFPTGKVEQTDKRYTVRLSAKYSSLEQLKNTTVFINVSGSKISVKDIAEVVDGIAEQTKISRLNNKDAIGVQVQKQSDANAVAVCKSIKEELKSIENEYASSNVKFNIASDNSVYTMESVNSVVEDLVLAIFIVSFVCFIFLHSIRTSINSNGCSSVINVTVIYFLYAFGYSLNIMSLMALSLAVGILVDDSIVVVENIFRHLEMGKTKCKRQ